MYTATFILAVDIMYTIAALFNVQSFFCTYITVTYIHGAFPFAPLANSPCSPLYPFHLLGTLQL